MHTQTQIILGNGKVLLPVQFGFRRMVSAKNALTLFVEPVQQVCVNGVVSNWIMSLEEGVHRGTIIEPLFFNLNINDLPEQVSENGKLLQYVDDCFFIL